MTEEKRRFQRIQFDAEISLNTFEDPQRVITGVLQDISLKGALIGISESYEPLRNGTEGDLVIRPEQGDIEITLSVKIAYGLPEKCCYGLDISTMDVDSAAHLRRLVEVNLGDTTSLQRELTNLIEAMEAEHELQTDY